MLAFLATLVATLVLSGVVGYALAALVIRDDDDMDSFL